MAEPRADEPIVEIALPDIENARGLDALIRKQVAKLQDVGPHLTSCRVAIEEDAAHPRSGSGFRIRVEAHLPQGKDIVVKRSSGQGDMHRELKTLVNDVFEATRRQVRKAKEQQRGHVKHHPEQQVEALISQLEDDYGFVRTVDGGRQVYFHANAVINDSFDKLQIGQGVAIEESMGDDGPQATTLRVVDHRSRTTDLS